MCNVHGVHSKLCQRECKQHIMCKRLARQTVCNVAMCAPCRADKRCQITSSPRLASQGGLQWCHNDAAAGGAGGQTKVTLCSGFSILCKACVEHSTMWWSELQTLEESVSFLLSEDFTGLLLFWHHFWCKIWFQLLEYQRGCVGFGLVNRY